MKKPINVITVLILANVALFAATELLPTLELRETLPLYFPKNEKFAYWQFLSSMFMHGNIMHILLNMYALWAFGSPLLERWGNGRFLTFYLLCGIGAGIIYSAVNYYQFNIIYEQLIAIEMTPEEIRQLLLMGDSDFARLADFPKEKLVQIISIYHIPAVGASGAIYGILVAFGILYPNSKLALIFLPIPIAAKYFIPAILLIDLFSGVTGVSIFTIGNAGIAHFAHLGGALIGFLLMLYWGKNTRRETI